MPKLKNYLTEASDKQITYNHKSVTEIGKKNFNKAFKLLKNNPEFVEELNNIQNHEEGLRQFLKSEEQRDLVVAAYLLYRNKEGDVPRDESPRAIVGLDVNNEKQFRTYAKKIIDDTRKTANILGQDTPSIEDIKKLRDADFDPEAAEEIKSGEKEEPEEEPEEPGAEPEEPETPADKPEEEPEEEDDDKEEEEEPEEKSKRKQVQQAKTKTGEDVVNVNRFPSPSDSAQKIEQIQQQVEQKVEEFRQKASDDASKEELKKIEKTANNTNKKINKELDRARKAQKGWENFPTARSAMSASVTAQKALNNAKRLGDFVDKQIQIKLAPGGVKRTAADIARAGQAAGDAAKKIWGSEKVKSAREALGRFGKQAAQAGKRAADLGKEEIAIVRQKLAAKDIAEGLGKEKANEFINLIKQGNTEKANEIAQEARRFLKQKKKESRLEKFQKEKIGEQNQALSKFSYIKI